MRWHVFVLFLFAILGTSTSFGEAPEAQKLSPLERDLADLQGAWHSYVDNLRAGKLVLIHGNRFFILHYADDKPINLSPFRGACDFGCAIEQRKDGRYLVLLKKEGDSKGYSFKYTLEKDKLSLSGAAALDIIGIVPGEYKRTR